jgi:hypothetical protein
LLVAVAVVVMMLVVEVQEVIVHRDMDQVHYKDQHKN